MEQKIHKEISDKNNGIVCSVSSETSNLISSCGLTKKDNEWTIFKWYTDHKFQHNGYGKLAMQELFKYCVGKYGIPGSVKYIWNGQNEYVGDWLQKNFDAVCCCSLSIMKNNIDDDWESHIYQLDVGKVLQYLGLN